MDALVTALVEFFNHTISQELTVLVISMLPILELRGGMLAAALLGVDRVQAFFICLFGTMLPIPFILLFIKRIFRWMSNTRFFKLVHRLEKRAEEKSNTIKKYKYLGLFIFVAIPLPGTGAWTGSLIAALLDMPFKPSIIAILLGCVTANVIMSLLSYNLLGAIL